MFARGTSLNKDYRGGDEEFLVFALGIACQPFSYQV